MDKREEKLRKAVREAAAFAEKVFREDHSGHDVSHTMRVYRTATALAEAEGAEVPVAQLAALLHDVDDRKLSPETSEKKDRAAAFLREQGVDAETAERVLGIIGEVSFRGTDSVTPESIEGKCVQDADRLDAIGAVGIARAFAYGGSRGRAMYDPEIPPENGMDAERYYASESTTLNHFHEKLFLLKDMMNTRTARELAAERDRFMRAYVDEFLKEWSGQA